MESNADPRIWGPLAWRMLTDVARETDASGDDRSILLILDSLRVLLPCEACRRSYVEHTRAIPPAPPYLRYVFELHNRVNDKLGVPAACRPGFETYSRRAYGYGETCSSYDLWDLAFLFAANVPPPGEPTARAKVIAGLSYYLIAQSAVYADSPDPRKREYSAAIALSDDFYYDPTAFLADRRLQFDDSTT